MTALGSMVIRVATAGLTDAAAAAKEIDIVDEAVKQLNKSIEDLTALDDLAQKSGASIENLSRLQQVAGAFGHDFGAVGSALQNLNAGMNDLGSDAAKTQAALQTLGVSATDAAGGMRDPAAVMVDVAAALQQYQDGGMKAALVMDLFRQSNADLVPFMNDTAEGVHLFSGRSAEAVSNAARFQDQMGILHNGMEQLAGNVTEAVLPALVGLARWFNESGWVDAAAMGIARVVDVVNVLPRLLSAVGGSFKAVFADIQLIAKVAEYTNPIGAIKAQMQGSSAAEEIRKALAERNKVVAAANKEWADLWDIPANGAEQAEAARIAARKAQSPAAKPTGAPAAAASQEKRLATALGPRGGTAKDDYEALNKSVQQRLALAQQEQEAGKAQSAMEKELARLQQGRADGTLKLSDAQFADIAATLQQIDSIDKSKQAAQEAAKAQENAAATTRAKIKATLDEAEANEKLAAAVGKSKLEVEQGELRKLKDAAAARVKGGGAEDPDETKLIDAQQKKVDSIAHLEEAEAAKKSLAELNAFLDPAKAEAFGTALKGAFGSAGDAALKLTEVVMGYGKRQDEIADQRKNADKLREKGDLSAVEYQEKIGKLNAAEVKNRLSGYGNMASAAAGFFGEQSKGYQVLMAVSKAFHVAELASSMAELAPKGIAAVLNQASGDPYTAFARMAAMAAAVASLGVAIGGIGGGGGADTTAKDRQKVQGTGSVLGDAEAKSDSIAKSLKLLEDHAELELSHTAGMLMSLRAIESSLSGLGSLLVRTAGVTGAVAEDQIGSAERTFNQIFGMGSLGEKLTGGALGKIVGSIFGGKVTTIDTGITIARTSLGNAVANGVVSSQYTDTKKDGGMFRSDKYRTNLTALGGEADSQFRRVIASLAGGIGEAANLLGVGGDAFTARLDSFVVDIGKISLKGLKGEEIQKELEAVFSKLGDDMAKFAVTGLDSFQKVGEGYFETLTRIASNYANLDSIMQSIGREFGAVGLTSIAARERLIEFAGGIDELASQTKGFADNYLTAGERLAPVQKYVTEQMTAMGYAGVTSRDAFKQLVLGLDTTTDAGARNYASLMRLQSAFAQVYPALNESADAAEVLAERKKLEARIYDLTHTSAEALARQRAEELAAMDESLRPLQERIHALQDEQSAMETLKNTMGGALAAVQKSVQAEKDAVTTAHQDAMKGLQKRIDLVSESVGNLASLSDALRSALHSMRDAAQATATRAEAQAKIASALAIAKAGGPLPKADSLSDALSVVSQDASSQFSSYLDYQRDLYRTANDVAALGRLTDAKLSTEERMLEVLEKQRDAAQQAYEDELAALDDIAKKAQQQVDQLNGLNTGVLSLAAAMNGLATAVSALKVAQVTSVTNPPPAAAPKLTVNDLYRSVLGRDAEQGGLEFWTKAFGDTIDADEVEQFKRGAQRELDERAQRPAARQATATTSSGGAVVHEIQRLRADISTLLVPLELTANNTNASANVLRRVSRDGQSFVMQDHMEEA